MHTSRSTQTEVFALYLYYEYRPAEAGATTKCIKPLHDLCLGLAILGLAMWPIAIFNRLPVVRQAFCGRGWLYPVQIVHCLALVAWLGFGIPWLMAIGAWPQCCVCGERCVQAPFLLRLLLPPPSVPRL